MNRATAFASVGVLVAGAVLALTGCPFKADYSGYDPGGTGGAVAGDGGIAVCGNGIVEMGEECDNGDAGLMPGCGSDCKATACYRCEGSPVVCAPEAAGTDCADGGVVCDGAGQCVGCVPVGTPCNTNEVACRYCDGQPCSGPMAADDCVHQCIDGYCCDGVCNGDCQGCNIPGSRGTCGTLSDGYQDQCKSAEVCSGGTCKPLAGKQPLGGPCANSDACVSGACAGGYCRLKETEACNESAECVTNHCQDNQCATCTGSECGTGSECVNGTCAAAVGDPCDANLPCKTGANCVGVCRGSLGATCTQDYQCGSFWCNNGTCDACNMGAKPCPNAGTCVGGTCPPVVVPSGNRCPDDSLCAVGSECTGFPPTCQ